MLALCHSTVSCRMEKHTVPKCSKGGFEGRESADECVWCFFLFFFLGVNGAVNGSGVCPPTTLSGSFPASSAPVQTATKPTKSPDSSNSHRSSTETSPVEVMEKPIQKPKEKASPLTFILPQFENMDKLYIIN